MPDQYKIDDETISCLRKAASYLNKGGVVAFPTETVMGLGVVFDNLDAYNHLNMIKNRPEEKPYSLMLADTKDIQKYAIVDSKAQMIIDAFLPGPLTILLPLKSNSVPNWVTHNTKIIAIRVPDHQLTNLLLSYTGKPILAPSANPSGLPPAMNSKKVHDYFSNKLDYIIEGEAVGEMPSTILDLTKDTPNIIRKGVITIDMIDNVLNKKDLSKITVAVGCDHGGFPYKEAVLSLLKENHYQAIDCGTDSMESVDYPYYAKKVADLVADKQANFGIVLCGSGEGVCIAANKIKGIRCGIGYNDEVSALLRMHNDANIIAFGARFMKQEDVLRRVLIFLSTDFEGDRHKKRVDLIKTFEK